ncbi:MAG: hypothetical protein QM640_12275 [Niabella sp.]
MLLVFAFASCRQIRKSYEDTLKPQPGYEQNHNVYPGSSSSSTTTSSDTTIETNASGNISKIIDEAMAKAGLKSGQSNYTSIYASADKLDSIQQELQNLPKLKGKKVNMYQQLYFYDFQDGIISVQIQDPDIPENVDEYRYVRGQWQQPTPVKITGNIPMKDYLFLLEKIKFSTAKKVHDQAGKKADETEGNKASDHVYFDHMIIPLSRSAHTIWYTSISGTRHDYYLDFDVNGNLKKIQTR